LFYPGTGAIRRKETHFANTLIGEVCHAGAAFAYHAVRCFFTGETRLDRQNLDVQLCEAKAHRVRSCCAWQILPIDQSFLLCWYSGFRPARYKSPFEKLVMKLINKAEYLMSCPD
jgi:hypothetical protein